jgi:NAD(P)-dependent dehydrogenase (short-subunit alcohol dehydrogenase family)
VRALVTGANRGLGLEVARQLAARGFEVLAGARDPAAVPEMENVRAVRLDVTDQGTIAALRRETETLDVLVNNAAIHYDTWESVLTADLDVVREALETNTLGAWRVAMAFAPLLKESGHGRLVNVSSGAGQLTTGMSAGAPAYSLSKAALNALTLMLADALRRDRVLVNAVCPGWVATDMGGPGGRPVREGAAGIVWAATLPDDGPTGGFFRDGRPIDW